MLAKAYSTYDYYKILNTSHKKRLKFMIIKQPYQIKKGDTVIFTVKPFKNDRNQWRYDICYGTSDYAVYTAKSESAVEAYYYGYMDGETDVLKITRPNNAE